MVGLGVLGLRLQDGLHLDAAFGKPAGLVEKVGQGLPCPRMGGLRTESLPQVRFCFIHLATG